MKWRLLILLVFPIPLALILTVFIVDIWQSGVKAGLQNIGANVIDLCDWIKNGSTEAERTQARANRAALRRALHLRSDR